MDYVANGLCNVDVDPVLKKVMLCQFPSIESWGYLYPKNIAVCLESVSCFHDILSQAMIRRT